MARVTVTVQYFATKAGEASAGQLQVVAGARGWQVRPVHCMPSGTLHLLPFTGSLQTAPASVVGSAKRPNGGLTMGPSTVPAVAMFCAPHDSWTPRT